MTKRIITTNAAIFSNHFSYKALLINGAALIYNPDSLQSAGTDPARSRMGSKLEVINIELL